jgi:hypothetical protein
MWQLSGLQSTGCDRALLITPPPPPQLEHDVSERVKYLLTVFHRSARAIIRLEMYVIVQSAMKYVVMHSFLYSMFYRILTTVPCTYVSCNKFYAIDASGSTKKTKIAHPLCVFFCPL